MPLHFYDEPKPSEPPAEERAASARTDAAAAAASLAATGDPDSFGRGMTYLGVAQTLTVALLPDCSASSPEFERCLTPAPSPETTYFDFADLARIDLPAKAGFSINMNSSRIRSAATRLSWGPAWRIWDLVDDSILRSSSRASRTPRKLRTGSS